MSKVRSPEYCALSWSHLIKNSAYVPHIVIYVSRRKLKKSAAVTKRAVFWWFRVTVELELFLTFAKFIISWTCLNFKLKFFEPHNYANLHSDVTSDHNPVTLKFMYISAWLG